MNRLYILITLLNILSSCVNNDPYKIPVGSFDDEPMEAPAKVSLLKENGKWRMFVNDKDYYIKGVASNNFYGKADDFGANTIRTYGVSNMSKAILDEAYENGLYVNFGLYIKRETDGFNYDDEVAVKKQFDEIKASVEKFKDHPALLVWSIGNEAESNYKNKKLWNAIGDIAEMIHEIDPNHPTTIALASSKVEHIKNIIDNAPGIDILSINSYAPNLPGVLDNIKSAGWDKPYMITEFGPRGTWQMAPEPDRILEWGALVEQTSTEKAIDYLNAYKDNIVINRDNGCLGSFVFLWGYQTHGEVLTWYGLFDKKGYTFQGVDEMQYVWTGNYPTNKAPQILSRNDMLMNGKKADDGIKIKVNSSNNTASVKAVDPEGDPLSYEWILIEEGTSSSDGSLPDGITNLIKDNSKSSIEFKAPSKAGKYRLIVFVRDDVNKKVASSVIPFKVE